MTPQIRLFSIKAVSILTILQVEFSKEKHDEVHQTSARRRRRRPRRRPHRVERREHLQFPHLAGHLPEFRAGPSAGWDR